ncbi:hypothetical protein M569_17749 [Genlisea aurea]|uniref:Uncharacterized protein n=1 Tax=Genlisea aurea TaxID=192259 RepID=S8BY36_9LAMI|nr:hypothetical protein M569_17749 [Genlisea aurea]
MYSQGEDIVGTVHEGEVCGVIIAIVMATTGMSVIGGVGVKTEEVAFGIVASHVILEEALGKEEVEDVGFCYMMSNHTTVHWIIDSGATHHICRSKDLIRDIKPSNVTLQTGRTEAKLYLDGEGCVVFTPRDNRYRKLTLQHVLYVKDANANIIAVKPFLDVGCSINMFGGEAVILHGGVVVLRGRIADSGLPVLDSHTPEGVNNACLVINQMSKPDTLRLIHNRLGHLHPDAIRKMIRERMVLGLPESLNLDDVPLNCPSCVAGKMTRQAYPDKKGSGQLRSDRESMKVGDEVCSDTFGPVSPTSRYGNRHIVEFIDKASAFGFVFGIPSLDMVTSKYGLVRNICDTQLGLKIKTFQSDGHGMP